MLSEKRNRVPEDWEDNVLLELTLFSVSYLIVSNGNGKRIALLIPPFPSAFICNSQRKANKGFFLLSKMSTVYIQGKCLRGQWEKIHRQHQILPHVSVLLILAGHTGRDLSTVRPPQVRAESSNTVSKVGLCFWPQSVCLCGGRLAEENSRLYSRSVAFSRPQNVLLAEHGGCAPTPGGHKRELSQSQKSERLFLSLKHNTIACLHISSSLILFFIIQNSTFVFRFDFQSFGNAYGRWNGEKMFQWSYFILNAPKWTV